VRIVLRGMGGRDLMQGLERSGQSELVGGVHQGLFFDSFWPNANLDAFLHTAARWGSFELNPWMEFDSEEVDRSEFLRIRCRKVVPDSPADFTRMRADLNALPWIGEDPKRRFRLPNRLWLSKIRLRPNEVGGVGQWTAEYVIAKGVQSVFENARLSGFGIRPVFNTRTGEPFETYVQLYVEHILGFRVLDLASPETSSTLPEERGYDALGCLCYDAAILREALAFNRTGERLTSFEFPDWVVRSAVRDCFRANRLRGWAFEPVLQLGSDRYETYCELWRSFYRVVRDCNAHTIRGRPLGPV
jgi:hypothetical protein